VCLDIYELFLKAVYKEFGFGHISSILQEDAVICFAKRKKKRALVMKTVTLN